MQTPVMNVFNPISPNFNSSALANDVSQMPKQEDQVNITIIYFVRDFLKELECLFLRVRDPDKTLFEDLVRQIFNCDLNSAEGINWLRSAHRNFNDFRNKFFDNIDELIDEFKEIRIR